MNNEQLETEVRSAVRSQAESVQPADRLGTIRARTRGESSPARATWWNRPWVLAAGTGLLAASVVITAVVLADPAADEPPVASGAERKVTVYEVQVLERAWLNPTPVSVPSSGDGASDAVVDAVDAWLTLMNVPSTVGVASATWDGPAVVVDFTGPVDDPWPDREPGWAYDPALVGQSLAWTVQPLALGRTPLVVTRDGQPVDELLKAPVADATVPDPSVLLPVIIESPTDDATVTSPVTISGTSDTFEANVVWEVVSDDGGVAKDGNTMGGTMGERAPFDFTVNLQPGTYTARAYAESAEDGSVVAEDTVTFTVE